MDTARSMYFFLLTDTCRKTLDISEVVGMVLMGLSKAYALPHDLFITKLPAYGFGPNSLALS